MIAVMIWHDGGDTFTTRKAIVPIESRALCESSATTLRELWRKDIPHATISVECVPVMRLVKA